MPQQVFILFPHHLFEITDYLKDADEIFLIEEFLFFNQYKFHKQKLVFHRASMKYYENYLKDRSFSVTYIDASDPLCDIRNLIKYLSRKNIQTIYYYDVCDNWLSRRIDELCTKLNINNVSVPSPLFINTEKELQSYFSDKQKYFQTDFYIQQRKKLNILVDSQQNPAGNKWSFDYDNRLKYPKLKQPPAINFPAVTVNYHEAIQYVGKNYSDNYGEISAEFIFPTTHHDSTNWLQQFFEFRFKEFGEYEDAIVAEANILHHSMLTPMLNVGLLTPLQVINQSIIFARENNIPLNSLEGFIRQIIGWREFIRGAYIFKGTQQRTTNFWKFKRKIPQQFYNGTTGIEPVDMTIKKVLNTGYCHHIERLMILGNFMLLCEFDPDEVYKWFMELFIDAYDWVMVPNVYGMSQFADGGIMSTKPYISSSAYILKMSNYKKGEWCEIWDALFWHFMNNKRNFFLSNPRLGMLIKTFDKMSSEKKSFHAAIAEKWLGSLDE